MRKEITSISIWRSSESRAARSFLKGGSYSKKMAFAFGLSFLLLAILGFMPAITQDGYLLGLFYVNTAHNFVHILTGVAALTCAVIGPYSAVLFFRIFGVVYGLLAVLGFFAGEEPALGFISNNMANAWLHTAIAAVSLLLGFGFHEAITALGERVKA